MKEILNAEVIVGHDQLGMEIKEAGCADLMADVLFFGKAGMLLLTGLTNPNVIETAHTLGVVAIIMVRGKRPPPETIRRAEELRIPLLSTQYILFETVGRLYVKGVNSCMGKVEESPLPNP
jgi:predicted transcriptional regulator